MKRSGFSMIELVFVIVILGVLAAVAVPRFVTTRTDAQVAMLRSDIASTLKAIPARVFAENLDPTQTAPNNYSNWGEWIIDTAGLDRGRWKVGSEKSYAVVPVVQNQSNVTDGNNGCGGVIYIETSTGILYFDPNQLITGGGASQTLCKALYNSYPSNSNRQIPLATTDSVVF